MSYFWRGIDGSLKESTNWEDSFRGAAKNGFCGVVATQVGGGSSSMTPPCYGMSASEIVAERWQNGGGTVIENIVNKRTGLLAVATGCFAVPHAGHMWMLAEAQRMLPMADIVILADCDWMVCDKIRRRSGVGVNPADACLESRVRAEVMMPRGGAVKIFGVVHEAEQRECLIEYIKPDVFIRGSDEDGVPFEFTGRYPVLRIPCLPHPGKTEKLSTSDLLRGSPTERH